VGANDQASRAIADLVRQSSEFTIPHVNDVLNINGGKSPEIPPLTAHRLTVPQEQPVHALENTSSEACMTLVMARITRDCPGPHGVLAIKLHFW